MGEIVWMGRRTDNGEVEEIGRGESLAIPTGYECVWPANSERVRLPYVIATGSKGAAQAVGFIEPVMPGNAYVGTPLTEWQPTDPDATPHIGLTIPECAQVYEVTVDPDTGRVIDRPRPLARLPEAIGETWQGLPGVWAGPQPLTAAEITAVGSIDVLAERIWEANHWSCPCCDSGVQWPMDKQAGIRTISLMLHQVEPYLPRPIAAAEVTEPGWYWYRGNERERWQVVEVWADDVPGRLGASLVFEESRYTLPDEMPGHFIGPLRAPE